MLQKIKVLLRGAKPNFRKLTPGDLMKKPRLMLQTPYFYTPKVQKLTYTSQLAKYCRYLQRKQIVDHKDMRTLVENMIAQYNFIYNGYKDSNKAEAEQIESQKTQYKGNDQNQSLSSHQVKQYQTHQQKFGVIKSYDIHPTDYCNYWGQVDWLLYTDQLHFFPVMFFQTQLNPYAGVGMAYSNMMTKNHLKMLYSDSQITNKNFAGYSLITNGQQWQLFKIQADLSTQKSVIFEAKETQTNKFRNIYSDPQLIATCLGLFQECLDIKDRDIRLIALQKVYQYLDEKKYMNERDTDLTLATRIILKLQNKTSLN